MNDASILDLEIRELFDLDHRQDLDRIIHAISLDQATSYVAALDQLHEAVESVSSSGGPSTVRALLEWSRSGPEDIQGTIQLLERRDDAVQSAYERATQNLPKVEVDPHGHVLLDSSQDVGAILTDPAEFERRLHRARRAAPGRYELDTGRELFRAEDRQLAEAGLDLVRSLEQAVETAPAHREATSVARMLDHEIEAAARTRHELRLLDKQIAEISEASVRDRARAEINERRATAHGNAVKLLDQLEVGARIRKLEQPDTPRGVHPGSHALHRKVTERMRELGRSDDEYIKTLEELVHVEPGPAWPPVAERTKGPGFEEF